MHTSAMDSRAKEGTPNLPSGLTCTKLRTTLSTSFQEEMFTLHSLSCEVAALRREK